MLTLGDLFIRLFFTVCIKIIIFKILISLRIDTKKKT